MPITPTIVEVSKSDPDRIAIADADRSITYGDLFRESPSVHAALDRLLKNGVGEDIQAPIDIDDIPLVALSLTRPLEAAAYVAMLAGYRMLSSVLDPLWPEAHRITSIRKAGARIVITDDQGLADALADDNWEGALLTPERVEQLAHQAQQAGALAEPERRDGEEPFLLLFTSGTTDLPKGFLRTRKSWRYNVEVSKRYLRCVPRRVSIAPGPLSYSLTLYALIEVLATGGSCYFQARFDAIETVALIDKHHIERFVGVPATLPAIVAAAKHRESRLASLAHVIVGGANLSEGLRLEFEEAVPSADLLSYYGAAEIGFVGHSTSGDGATLQPFAGVDLSIRRDDGSECAEGELGTVFVRVPSQADRYISTSGGLSITGEDGWSSVNDQGFLQDGQLTLVGRAGDFAVTGGHKVSLTQVERTLETLPGCEQCCVVTQPDARLGSLLVAVIEGTSFTVPAKHDMQEHLRQRLSPQFVPHRFYRADELPRTIGGKIRRGETAQELAAGAYQRL